MCLQGLNVKLAITSIFFHFHANDAISARLTMLKKKGLITDKGNRDYIIMETLADLMCTVEKEFIPEVSSLWKIF